MINSEVINKIIYFDKETIRNILQEQNKGSKTTQTDYKTTTKATTEVNAEAKIHLGMPFFDRLSFLLSGKIGAQFMIKRDNSTTISSTEISEFEQLKSRFFKIEDTLINDIENSSTFFRVAGGYLRIVKGGVDEVDTKEFNAVMDSFDGYDTYKVSPSCYVRFNNSAFVSNYKRNDLLATKMTLYCIEVGMFEKEKFDFIKQLSKMEKLLSGVNQHKSLAEAFPLKDEEEDTNNEDSDYAKFPEIQLYDVVYACVSAGGKND